MLKTVLSALGIETRDCSYFRFSPSIISLGWEYALLSWCEFVLGLEEESKGFLQELRPVIGYLFEHSYHLDHPELVYQKEFKCKNGLEGTVDFHSFNDGLLTVIDTKCVATSVARKIKEYNYPAYFNQVQLYAYALKEHYQLDETTPTELKLVVCDRNYLNVTEVSFDYSPHIVADLLTTYSNLLLAAEDEGYFRQCMANIKTTHEWSRYKPHGKYFEFTKEGVVLKQSLEQLMEDVICKQWNHK